MRLINADDVVEKAYHEAEEMAKPFNEHFGWLVERLVDKTPTVKQKRGKCFILNSDFRTIECTCCKQEFLVDSYRRIDIGLFAKNTDFKFCPDCGARMREV